MLSALPNGDGGTGRLEIDTEQPEAVLSSITGASLRDATVLRRSDTGGLVQFETASPMLLRATQSSGVPVSFPFEIRDGVVNWTFTVLHDRLSTLRAALDDRGTDYQLGRIRGVNVEEDVLTAHQRDVLEAAIDAGYYEQPRDVSLTALAAELEMAKSTLSGVLRRAEAALVTSYVDDGVDTGQGTRG
ncbi:MAG: helix-turn-helix domain-containing protein [Halolamina sp.]